MENIKKYLLKYCWVLIILLSVPVAQALLVPGYYGASDDMHIAWLYEMDQAVKIGQIPPRFVPDLSFAFGYPLFNFLFPLPFYLAEIFHLIGFSMVDSVKALFLLSVPVSALLMYKLLREITTAWLSVLGAVVYIYTPYRATDIYVRGAMGEVLAFVFLPLIILALIKLAKPNYRWVGILALAIAALVLSHNITVYMFMPAVFLLALMLLLFVKVNRKIVLFQMVLAVFLGLLASIYFWLPAILDSKLMKYDTVFNFSDHFPTFKQLITPYFGYGASVPGPYDGMSFFIGSLNLALVIAGLILLIIFWKKYSALQKIILIWADLVFAVAVIMMNYRSEIIWKNIPLLPYFQFPWRFLILTTLVTPIMVIALTNIKHNLLLSVVLIIITISVSANFFRPHDFLGRFDDYYLRRYIPAPVAQKEYYELEEEYLRLPKNTQYRPANNFPLAMLDKEGQVKIIKSDGLNSLLEVNAALAGNLSYTKYNFLGWEVWVDGQKAIFSSGLPFGQISIPLTSGSHLVKIQFKETGRNKILDIISTAALLLCSLFLVNGLIRKLLDKNRQGRYN